MDALAYPIERQRATLDEVTQRHAIHAKHFRLTIG
jgi:hypothetical protein